MFITNKSDCDSQIELAVRNNDIRKLDEISDLLSHKSEPWASIERFKIANQKIKLKKAGAASYQLWFEKYHLPDPDGRELYAYDLSKEAFLDYGESVKAFARKDHLQFPGESALFVFWAAAWFRFSYQGGVKNWEDVGNAIGLQLTQKEWRDLTDEGLRLWHLKPRKLKGREYRLQTLALEGGFPLFVLENGSEGWASKYLEHLVGALLAEPEVTSEEAFGLAEELKYFLPAMWQSDAFYAVSSELALSITKLRQEADKQAKACGLSPFAWLNLNQPDWRRKLPLSARDGAGKTLIDGLVQTAARKVSYGQISAHRHLRNINGKWTPFAQLKLDGQVVDANLDQERQNWSRLRCYATGKLAQYLPGEMCVLETEEDSPWIARQSRKSEYVSIPFTVPITMECRGDGAPVGRPITLPHGSKITSPLLVFQVQKNAPDDLKLIGISSGTYDCEKIYILTPTNWQISARQTKEDVACICEDIIISDSHLHYQLHTAIGPVCVTTDDGERYSLQLGAGKNSQYKLELEGDPTTEFYDPENFLPVFRGLPEFYQVTGQNNRHKTRADSVKWRTDKNTPWRNLSGFNVTGKCDFLWLDRDGFIIDRISLIIIPEDFSFSIHLHKNNAIVEIKNWPGTTKLQKGLALSEGKWKVPLGGKCNISADFLLSGYVTANFRLTKRVAQRSWIEMWDGTGLRERELIALSDLHKYVARAEGKSTLVAELHDKNQSKISESYKEYTFNYELPLNSIRDELENFLLQCGDIDAKIRIYFLDRPEIFWTVSDFTCKLWKEDYGLYPKPQIVVDGIYLAGRALHQPQKECNLVPYTLERIALSPTIPKPDIFGTWLLYLRTEAQVFTRPIIFQGKPLKQYPQDAFAQACLIGDPNARKVALNAVADEARGNDKKAYEIRQKIIDLSISLNQLQPATFDIFNILSNHPMLIVRLLFDVAEEKRQALIELLDKLPLSLSTIPPEIWDSGGTLTGKFMLNQIPPEQQSLLLDAIAQNIAQCRKNICQVKPYLSHHNHLSLSKSEKSLMDASQDFVRREHDRIGTDRRSPFRPRLKSFLPAWPFDVCFFRALDAPIVAALIATGKVTTEPEWIRCIKDIEYHYPNYFRDAYITKIIELEKHRG